MDGSGELRRVHSGYHVYTDKHEILSDRTCERLPMLVYINLSATCALCQLVDPEPSVGPGISHRDTGGVLPKETRSRGLRCRARGLVGEVD